MGVVVFKDGDLGKSKIIDSEVALPDAPKGIISLVSLVFGVTITLALLNLKTY